MFARCLSLMTVVVAVALVAVFASLSCAQPAETREQRDARMEWWREARFGMFIHWGLYAVPAGTWHDQRIGGIGEWIMNSAKVPVNDYAAFASQFNPTKFNADEWVRIAKDAGMKYIVITSKHHDGFAMFGSAASDHNIRDATPFKRDPLKELAEACRKAGIKLGFYYSQAQDWHHPGGAAAGGHWDKAQDGSMDEYLKTVAVPQVREILSNYGPLAILWWDTPFEMTRERAEQFLPLLSLQPGIITNNRLGGGFAGDSETPEQEIPATGFGDRDWETCMTMNDTWGFKSYDSNWKPTITLIRNLVDIASKGGNYLLNVGPTAEGLIPQPSIERLAEVGKWMKVNGEAIYGTSPSPFRKLAWGRCTRKPGRLYLHVLSWPKDGKLLVPTSSRITKAYLLADPETGLAVAQSERGAVVSVPQAAPDANVSVLALDIEGEPQVMEAGLVQAEDGTVSLAAADADISAKNARLEGGEEQNVGFWTDVNDMLQWQVKVTKPGTFEVEVNQACEPGTAGAEYALVVGDQALVGKVAPTANWQDYKVLELGQVRIEKPGIVSVFVRPFRMPGYAVMNLRSVVLRLVGE